MKRNVHFHFQPNYQPEFNNPRTLPPTANNFSNNQPDNELTIINLGNNNSENKNAFIDVTHEAEEVSFSLEKQEKDMIIKALQKNKNKRKYAAQDLGISERTLYRKIKQYDIEEE